MQKSTMRMALAVQTQGLLSEVFSVSHSVAFSLCRRRGVGRSYMQHRADTCCVVLEACWQLLSVGSHVGCEFALEMQSLQRFAMFNWPYQTLICANATTWSGSRVCASGNRIARKTALLSK